MKIFATLALFAAVASAGHPNYGSGYNAGYEAPAPQLAHPTTVMKHETAAPVMVHETTPVHQKPAEVTAPAQYSVGVEAPAAGPKTHTVTVGGDGGLVYTPPYLSAAAGDTVTFVFHKQNHSVTQSTFEKPCNRLETGEDSGLKPNPNNTVTPAPTWDYIVKDEKPTWWYCKQRTGAHCGKGMVFAINPTAEKSFAQFKELAIKINGTATAVPSAPSVTATSVGTVTLIAGPTDAPSPTAPPQEVPSVAPGWNKGGNPAACNCACFCGVGSFPQGDGIGNYGGIGGSMASPW